MNEKKHINPEEYLKEFTEQKGQKERELLNSILEPETLDKLVNSGLPKEDIYKILNTIEKHYNQKRTTKIEPSKLNALILAFLESNLTAKDIIYIIKWNSIDQLDEETITALIKSNKTFIDIDAIMVCCNLEISSPIVLSLIKKGASTAEIIIESHYAAEKISPITKRSLEELINRNINMSPKELATFIYSKKPNQVQRLRMYGNLRSRHPEQKCRNYILDRTMRPLVILPGTEKRIEKRLIKVKPELTKTHGAFMIEI